MRLSAGILILFAGALASLGQNPPSRTPGRVGGSPNRPSVLQPHTGARAYSALDASAVLTPDEQKLYSSAQQYIPGLTVYDFFQIQYLSDALHNAHIETDPAKLAQEIGAEKNHVVAALEQLGVGKDEAKKMYASAQAAAESRAKQLSQ